MASSFNKFNSFVADVANGVHNLATASLKVALTDTLPVSTNAVLADISQISYTNLSSRAVTTTSSTQTSGTYKLLLAQPTLTASGNVAQFRYVVLYNDSATSKQLIGWYDDGGEINLTNGDAYVVGFDTSAGTLTIV